MKTHTLGFIFTENKDKVVLILKEKPASQKGKLNGIGGKIEVEESSENCISRETKEETDLDIAPDKWQKYAQILMENEIGVDVFVTTYIGEQSDARSSEGLKVEWYPVDNLPENVMSNLNWLIPAAIDFINDKQLNLIKASYKKS